MIPLSSICVLGILYSSDIDFSLLTTQTESNRD